MTVDLGRRLSGAHGIGITKAPYLKFEIHDKELNLMRSLKRLFDPNSILNPGKIFPDQLHLKALLKTKKGRPSYNIDFISAPKVFI